MKRLFIVFILLITGSLQAQDYTPYRIRLPDSTNSAQLRGYTGTRTAGEIIDGTWSTYFKMHIFTPTLTGYYQLYVDPAGGSTYSLVSTWGDSTYATKHIPGSDQADWWENIDGDSLRSTGLGDTCISTIKVKDDNITDAKLSHTGVTAGTYTRITATVNDQGRLTSAANGTAPRHLSKTFNMTDLLRDTSRIAFNFSGQNVTIDSILAEGYASNQLVKIFSIPYGGGAATLIDSFVVSNLGQDRYYKTETTLTNSTWADSSALYILRAGTDTELTLTFRFEL